MDRRGMDEPSDEDLMRRVARGDQAAFRTLSRRCVPPAVGLARRILDNSADAEEVVQEAMLRVWTNAPQWRPEALFRTWLYRVVVNLCLNRKRRRPFASLTDAGDPADPAPDPAAQMERTQRDRAVAVAIARLPERQRAAIVLTYHEGLSNADAAAALGTTRSAVETLLVRAKQALRRELASIDAGYPGNDQ
jgi:RNA polymerase sigma-70 factor (ECF subfamily)